MKSIMLELDGIDISIAYDVEYTKVVEADTPFGAIYRDKISHFEILHICGVKYTDNWESDPFEMSEEELFNHITYEDLLSAL